MRRVMRWTLYLTLLPVLVAVCDAGSEPARVRFPVAADGSGVSAFETDLGYTVELTECRVALRDLEFTVEGETHARWYDPLRRAILSEAMAHPGHYAGGEVTGELPGRFVLDAFAGSPQSWGEAELLEGEYHGMNFYFRRAEAADGLPAGDPLLGHTAVLAGTARRGSESYPFRAVLDVDDGVQMVGAPFTLDLRPDTGGTLTVRILALDPSTEEDSLLDGIDFAALLPDGGSEVVIGPGEAAHNVARRTLQVHDHWWVQHVF